MAIHKKIISDEILAIHNHINGDIKPLLTASGGYYGSLSQLFSLINYVGALYSGKSSHNESETIEFIKKFFKPIYSDFPALLYIIIRHGTLHERVPKIIQLRSKGRIIYMYVSKRKYRPNHLKIVKLNFAQHKSEIAISISIPHLIEDFHLALDQYLLAILKKDKYGRQLRANFSKAWVEIREPKTEVLLLTKYNQYLKSQEFDFIRKQIKQNIPQILVT